MKIRKRILVPVSVAVIAGGSLASNRSIVEAYARYDHRSPELAQKLSQRLNLSEQEVQEILDGIQAERQAERKTSFEQKVNQALQDKKITQEQKEAILDKHEELLAKWQENHDRFDEMSKEERKAERQRQKRELETWAKELGINVGDFFSDKMRRRLY